MRLRLLDRVRRLTRLRDPARWLRPTRQGHPSRGSHPGAGPRAVPGTSAGIGSAGRHRRDAGGSFRESGPSGEVGSSADFNSSREFGPLGEYDPSSGFGPADEYNPSGEAGPTGESGLPGEYGLSTEFGPSGESRTSGQRSAGEVGPVPGDVTPSAGWTAVGPRGPAGAQPARPGMPAVRAGSARARIREDPAIPVPRAATKGTVAARTAAAGRQPASARSGWRSAHASLRARLPFAAPHSRERPATADGRRNCGSIERVLWRQWDTTNAPPSEVIAAVDRLAELPERIKETLADGLDAIYIGPGGVPELDDMTALRGVSLPSGRASWDACAGAYGERKIVVGSQPSPTPDVMCHEIGHALDDLDSPPGKWQSDSAQFRMLYDQCQPHLASDFHRQPGGLGRKEFFADAFAAIASGQRPALVDMLSGETRTALRVMLYFNRRYDI